MLTIKTYANTDFANIMVKKALYEQLEEAKRLETTPDKAHIQRNTANIKKP